MAQNPNPSRITEAMWWLAEQLEALEPPSECGGIYANKPGYHNTRAANSKSNYSVREPPDWGGPSDKAAALDWTFPDAQRGDYRTISKYCQRLWSSSHDMNDPRLNGWREWYGQIDSDRQVEGWDCRHLHEVSSDDSHLWHIHFSETRSKVTDYANKQALLSVLRGETVVQWLTATGPQEDEVSVINKQLKPGFAYDVSGDNRVEPSNITVLAGEWANESASVPTLGKATLAIGTQYGEPNQKVRLRVEYAERNRDGKEWFPRVGKFHDIGGDTGQAFTWINLPDGSYGVIVSRVPFSSTDSNDTWPVDVTLFYGIRQG